MTGSGDQVGRAVFWKREVGDDGTKWIEPTEADLVDRAYLTAVQG